MKTSALLPGRGPALLLPQHRGSVVTGEAKYTTEAFQKTIIHKHLYSSKCLRPYGITMSCSWHVHRHPTGKPFTARRPMMVRAAAQSEEIGTAGVAAVALGLLANPLVNFLSHHPLAPDGMQGP